MITNTAKSILRTTIRSSRTKNVRRNLATLTSTNSNNSIASTSNLDNNNNLNLIDSTTTTTTSSSTSQQLRTRTSERIKNLENKIGPPPPPPLNSNSITQPFLQDSFGRKHNYLRISLTEKCNLRCTYCMPESGVPLLPKDNLLTTLEIERVAKMFIKEGVTKIRLTGGEPTVRKDLLDVVEKLGNLGLESLGMTSNGIALKRKLPTLVSKGLTHLNISLDTLDTFKYELITRRRGFETVMESIEIAMNLKQKGLNTKINCVVIRGLNDQEIPAFVELTKEMDITVRFIEYMPFEDNKWSTQKLIPSADLLETITKLHPNIIKLENHISDTTRSWKIPGYKGKIGFISSMSDHFCAGCTRLRIGADGGVKVCLFGAPVLALRPLLRTMKDSEILPLIGKAVFGKKFAHDGLGGASGIHLNGKSGPMVSIGAFASSRSVIKSRRYSVPLHILPNLPSTSFSSIRHSSSFAFNRGNLSSYTSSRHSSSSTNSPTSPPSTIVPAQLTHIDPKTGLASMVSVSSKLNTLRSATAIGTITLTPYAYSLILQSTSTSYSLNTKKGEVFTIAQLAGIMGSKQTSSLIPLCHPLSLSHISIKLIPNPKTFSIDVIGTAECEGKTGVEMEAIVGVMTSLVTIWDMLKAVAGKEMIIGNVKVVKKSGGKSGDWVRED